ncbi:MAG: hypothetical protein QW813_00270 [Candidatus Aenigmatarchaeota archaeon]
MVFNWFRRLIKKESINQSITNQSINHKSINQSQINQSITSPENIQLQKDALELGLAAGYASHLLKSIENSIERLESMVLTKQWAETYLLPLLKSIADNEQKRFETLLSVLNHLRNTSYKLPKNVQTLLEKPILDIEKEVTKSPKLTPQMQKLFSILKEVGEISYSDLSKRMGMKSEDGLRGFLSIVNKKFPGTIDRFEKEGKRKWVRLKKAQNELIYNQSQINQSDMFSMFNDQTLS